MQESKQATKSQNQQENATCISCGMPMRNAKDHALSDGSKAYCQYCAQTDGSMKSYSEVLKGLSGFLKQTQGLDEKAAHTAAEGMMANLPAWKNKAKS